MPEVPMVGIGRSRFVFGMGRVLRPTAGKRRVILARLMLRAGNGVPASDLMTCLWDEVPPPTAKEAFCVHLMRLCKEMARILGAADGLLVGAGRYQP
ncbi:hypothetical protein ABZW10_05045 [Kitasatospora sp. NPDC004723]|uniref:hypothetical protein n=1 Tax=Kitasatospora sp. NPDC004723 TaxID=3154288 RepID=UPI0033A67F53